MAGQVFNGNINALATSWMMIYMLVFAVVWEAGTDALQRATRDNKMHSEMLTKVAKELMILGFIAFSVILLKEFNVLHWNAETLHVFEFCDLLVSICVLIYVGNCAISSLTMAGIEREWDRISMTQTSEIMKKIDAYLASLDVSCWKRFRHRIPLLKPLWRSDADFKILQMLFGTKFFMPLQFDYVQYMKLVLTETVVTTANIGMWHWALIMMMNGLWWLTIKFGLPVFDMVGTPDDHICLFEADMCGVTDVTAAHRRLRAAAAATPEVCRAEQLGASCRVTLLGGTCPSNTSGLEQALAQMHSNATAADWGQCGPTGPAAHEDITASATRTWLIVYVMIGWVVVLLQAAIVVNIGIRMNRILVYSQNNEAVKKDKEVVYLLGKLQKAHLKHERDREKMDSEYMDLHYHGEYSLQDDREEATVESHAHRHRMITLDHDHHNEYETDHIMLFKDADKTSNDVMSIGTYDTLMFLTQLFQLVIDFYLGFYLVHMSLRIPLAFGHTSIVDGAYGSQLMFHVAILLPVMLMLYLLMLTTRNISLLIGVLHLNEDAVSQVLQHMELIKSIRNRIRDTLSAARLVHRTKNAGGARKMLTNATNGEVAILKLLEGKPKDDRITAADMHKLINAHPLCVKLKSKDLGVFLDRATFRDYELLAPVHQATVQTARTLEFEEKRSGDSDTIEVREFCAYLVRLLGDIIDKSLAMSLDPASVNVFRQTIVRLLCVDNQMLTSARELARIKALFRATDTDHSGEITRTELYAALRKFKVPITKTEFKQLFRVVDPDQTHSLNLAEWIDFMSCDDSALDQHTKDAGKGGAAKVRMHLKTALSTFNLGMAEDSLNKTKNPLAPTQSLILADEAGQSMNLSNDSRLDDLGSPFENPLKEKEKEKEPRVRRMSTMPAVVSEAFSPRDPNASLGLE